MTKEKILITGHRGFVGKYLWQLLKTKNKIIFGLDLPDCDITRTKQVEAKILKIAPDKIYHLAGFAKTTGAKELTFKVNVNGTRNILASATKLKKPVKILLASSGIVYGNCKRSAKEDDKISPVGDYAKSKAQMEKEALKLQNDNLKIVISRAFNHTGAGQKLGFVLPDFAWQIAQIENGKMEKVLKVGDLSAKRELLNVKDVIRAYYLIMEKGQQQIYNISNGKPYTIKQILNKLLKQAKTKIKVEIDKKKLRKSEVKISFGSFAKIKKELGWQPIISIDQTLKETLNYWRENLSSK